MNSNRQSELIHELEGIRANLSSCFHKITADRRAKNPYAELGWEVLNRLESLIEKLNQEDCEQKEKPNASV